MHPARLPSVAATSSVSSPQTDIIAAGPLAEFGEVELPGFGDAAPDDHALRSEEVYHRGDAVREIVPVLLHGLHGAGFPSL